MGRIYIIFSIFVYFQFSQSFSIRKISKEINDDSGDYEIWRMINRKSSEVECEFSPKEHPQWEKYITKDVRIDLCKSNYPKFNSTGTVHLTSLIVNSNFNPCETRCYLCDFEDPDNSLDDVFNDGESSIPIKCPIEMDFHYKIVHFSHNEQCEENMICEDECCRKDNSIRTVTTVEPTTVTPEITTFATTQKPTTVTPEITTFATTQKPTTVTPKITTFATTQKPTTVTPEITTFATTQKPTTVTPEITSTFATTKNNHTPNEIKYICDGNNYRNPKNCHEFYVCEGSRVQIIKCAANLVFDEKTKQCQYSSQTEPCHNIT